MAIKVDNISDGKVIGIGSVTVLPGQDAIIPAEYENSPVLEIYVKAGLLKVSGEPTKVDKVSEDDSKKQKEDLAAAEELRKACLASLNGISEENLGRLAVELGINLATCKDQADVLKKVKAQLK